MCILFQSATALEFVKNDLAEFTTTVQQDTTRVASDFKDKMTVNNVLAFLCLVDLHTLYSFFIFL